MERRYRDAKDWTKKSLAIEREVGFRAGEARSLHQLGVIAHAEHHCDDANDYYQESLAIEREIGNRDGAALTLRALKALKDRT